MISRGKEFFVALLIYVVTMTVLLMAVYRFLENWHLSEFNFFVAGALVLLVAVGWGYILTALIFAPGKQMEDTLTTVTNDIMHELNIPLSTIEANTNMLRKTLEDEKSLKRIQRIEDASLRLKRLYDELVYTLSKEIRPVTKVHFDVEAIVKERVDTFEEQGRNNFVLKMYSYQVEMDKIGFEQMLDNILTNAMKYSKKTSTIFITLKEGILCIKDEGIGMHSSELLRIHERYFQGDIKDEGKGIGLTLVKHYCDEANISIDIQSQKNVGTVICIDLSEVHR